MSWPDCVAACVFFIAGASVLRAMCQMGENACEGCHYCQHDEPEDE